jgi:hypothetical protein
VIVLPIPFDSDSVGFNVMQDGKPCTTATPSRDVFGLAGIERGIAKPFAWAAIFNLEVVLAGI